MPYLIWRNGTGLPEYPAAHLRTVTLRPGEDPLEVAQRYMSRDHTLSDYVGVVDTLPPSRRFRNCWRHGAGAVAVSMPLARQQRLAEIRSERNERLVESDKDHSRLADIGTDQQRADLRTYRQALRDLPATVQTDLAALTTPEQLDQYQPAWPVKP